MGAQRPMKIPNRSAWARDSADISPLVIYHMKIEPRIERKPQMKQKSDSNRSCFFVSFNIITLITLPPYLIFNVGNPPQTTIISTSYRCSRFKMSLAFGSWSSIRISMSLEMHLIIEQGVFTVGLFFLIRIPYGDNSLNPHFFGDSQKP